MGSGIQMCSIEMGRLSIMLGNCNTTQLLERTFPSMQNITLKLYRAQRRRIGRRFSKSRDRIEALRCRILLLLDAGESPAQISRWIGCARATVYRTLYRFENLGEAALIDQRCSPGPRKVTTDVMHGLLSLLDQSPREKGWQRSTWTLELLAMEILQQTGIHLSSSHIRNLLLDLKCRRGRPRPALRIPVRGRRRILEKISRLVQRASAQEEVFYVDEADVDLNPRIGLTYIKKGNQPHRSCRSPQYQQFFVVPKHGNPFLL
jgi:putative transposase